MISEEEKYHLIIKEYKNYIVSIQAYELAAHIREIETTYFKVSRPSGKGDGTFSKPHAFDNYTGFDKDKLIKSLESLPLKIEGSKFIIRDIKLKKLLD